MILSIGEHVANWVFDLFYQADTLYHLIGSPMGADCTTDADCFAIHGY